MEKAIRGKWTFLPIKWPSSRARITGTLVKDGWFSNFLIDTH